MKNLLQALTGIDYDTNNGRSKARRNTLFTRLLNQAVSTNDVSKIMPAKARTQHGDCLTRSHHAERDFCFHARMTPQWSEKPSR